MRRSSKESKYLQGRFRPTNPHKYKGDPNNIIYRSSYELEFMKWCDRSENVLQYSSEEFFIPYVSPIDNRVHRYFPDFLIKIKENTGEIKTYVIEVKPKKQLTEPKVPKRKSKSWLYEMNMYNINQAKWKAAKEFCDDRRMSFKIITEDNIFN